MSLDFKILKAAKFIKQTEEESDLRSDLHFTQFWADVFWRRRRRHAKRVDPEINVIQQFISKFNNCKILEIGPAYGRFTTKLFHALNQNTNQFSIKGIEVCTHFQPYFDEYKQKNPILSNVKILHDNFFKTEMIKPKSINIIVLPMNTLPGFPFQALDVLFSKIKEILTDDGYFIFSSYKLIGSVDSIKKSLESESSSSELLIGKDIIATEHIVTRTLDQDYGLKSIEFIAYNRLTRDYRFIERSVFRSQREFILEKKLDDKLENNGFKVVLKDDKSHSRVYVVKKS